MQNFFLKNKYIYNYSFPNINGFLKKVGPFYIHVPICNLKAIDHPYSML